MDVILAILVLGAVIFFGALISAGNERQRKALDGIREQAALWAMQDLRLKREKLEQNVIVDDPVVWLNQVVAKVYGENLNLIISEILDEPQVLVCLGKGERKLLLSPTSPNDLRNLTKKHKSKLSSIGNANPLMSLPRSIEKIEISILNAGIFFDLELPIAWKLITGHETMGNLWLYNLD